MQTSRMEKRVNSSNELRGDYTAVAGAGRPPMV
jgi:hypothetical protein